MAFGEEQIQPWKISPSRASLPFDVIRNILTRVDLKTLLQHGKWVCKDWHQLTYNFDFKRNHFEKSQTISGYFISTGIDYETRFVSVTPRLPLIPSLSLDFLPVVKPEIVASSPHGGLLCCIGQGRLDSSICYYICKPSTRQWIKIPNPKNPNATIEMVMVIKRSDPLHYIVIRFSCHSNVDGFYSEIFDSKYWEWKKAKDVKMKLNCISKKVKSDYVIAPKPRHSVYLYGVFHWLTDDGLILAYNVEDGTWKMISLSQQDEEVIKMNKDSWVPKLMVDYEGKVGVFYKSSETWMELHVMEDYHNQVWNKKERINLEKLYQCNINPKLMVPLDSYATNTILMYGGNKMILYDIEMSNAYIEMEVPQHEFNQIYVIQSDLLPCKLARPKRKGTTTA